MPAPSIGGAHTPTDPGTGMVWGSDGAGRATPVVGGSSSGVAVVVAQTAHGFSVGQAIRPTGGGYVLAKADVAADGDVVALVSAVADADHFTAQPNGRITGLSALTAGTVYYLDPAVAGGLTSTEPSAAGQVSKPVLIADTATSGFIVNLRGLVTPSPAITYFAVQLVDELTSVATGEGKAHLTVTSDLNGLSLVSVVATASVAPTGSGLSFGVRKNAATEMLTTNVTIDTTKKSSELSATPPVIKSDGSQTVATGDIVWIDCDQADSNSISRGSGLRLGFS